MPSLKARKTMFTHHAKVIHLFIFYLFFFFLNLFVETDENHLHPYGRERGYLGSEEGVVKATVYNCKMYKTIC